MLTARDAEHFMKTSQSFTEKSGLDIQNEARMEQVNKKLASEAEAKAAIKVADAKNHVGSTVKVTRKNVPEKEYRLIGASGRRLELTQNAGRGSYSFHYNIRDIEKIRVLTRQQY
jgi:pantoate kinase